MIDAHVIKLGLEYLDHCASKNQQATLVGMHWHIDAHNKTLPMLEEVNEMLERRPSIYVQRQEGNVIFAAAGSERNVNSQDMSRADKRYREEFDAALKKL